MRWKNRLNILQNGFDERIEEKGVIAPCRGWRNGGGGGEVSGSIFRIDFISLGVGKITITFFSCLFFVWKLFSFENNT